MKTKILAGYLAIAIVFFAIASVSLIVGLQVTENVNKVETEYNEMAEINELISGLYEEHTLAIKYITTENSTVAKRIMEEKENLSEDNHVLCHRLFEGFQEEPEQPGLKKVEEKLDNIDSVFEDIIALKEAGQLGAIRTITDLNEIIDRIINGNLTNDQEGLDYVIECMAEELDEAVENGDLNNLYNLSKDFEDIHRLIQGIYNEQFLAILALTTTDLDEASAIIEQKEALCEENHELYANILVQLQEKSTHCPVHAELAVVFENLNKYLVEMDEVCETNMTYKLTGQLDATYWIALIDELLLDIMVGEGPDDQEGLDYIQTEIQEHIEESKKDAEDSQRFVITFAIVGTIIVIFIAIIMGVVISKSISKPIEDLSEAAKNIEKGNLEAKVEAKSNNEIGELAGSFESMRIGLRSSMGELEKARSILDFKVKERTKDLASANNNLIKEVKERQQAEKKLTKSMFNLKRFNHLTVGREQRMIELKHEINELMRAAGHEQKYRIPTMFDS